MLLVIVIYATTLLLVGLFATPNNYDSMTYHLARIAHWQQDQSIAFYGTNIPRQNFMSPWAEWLMFQLILLQGDDQLVNLVQGFSYIGCMIAASLITELLGGTRRDAIFAAFFIATLPAATFEATSTQNDLVMSFWLLCCVYACLKLWSQPGWLGASFRREPRPWHSHQNRCHDLWPASLSLGGVGLDPPRSSEKPRASGPDRRHRPHPERRPFHPQFPHHRPPHGPR